MPQVDDKYTVLIWFLDADDCEHNSHHYYDTLYDAECGYSSFYDELKSAFHYGNILDYRIKCEVHTLFGYVIWDEARGINHDLNLKNDKVNNIDNLSL